MIVLYVFLNMIGSYFFLGAILSIGRTDMKRSRKWVIAFLMSVTFRVLLNTVPALPVRVALQLLIHWGVLYWVGQLSIRRSLAVLLTLFTVSVMGELLTLHVLESAVRNFDILMTLEAFYAFTLVAYIGVASVCYLLAKRIASSDGRDKWAAQAEIE